MGKLNIKYDMNTKLGLGALGLFFAVLLVAGIFYTLGYRYNGTQSYPRGFYKLSKFEGSPEIGRLVMVCPPDTQVFRQALQRQYIYGGTCKGGFTPLLKKIAAVSGMRIEVTDHLIIDGVQNPMSQILDVDGQGRPLPKYEGGTLSGDEVLLLSDYTALSFDSRYFGPLSAKQIIGYASPVRH